MNIVDFDGEIVITMTYSTSMISAWDARNLVETFDKTCSAIASNPFQSIEHIEILSSRDLSQILEWNAVVPQDYEDCVHHLIGRVVDKQPNAPAISSWGGTLSYSELDDLSSRLASLLINLGVKAEVIVPLLFEKSMWAIVSMIAVLKAGGACVSLNPTHTLARQENIVQEVKATVIIASPSLSAGITGIADHVIDVDQSLFLKLSGKPLLNSVVVSPRNSAFVVFTSGSTGTPKGIIQEHGSFCAGVRDYMEELQLDAESRVLQFAAYTFDASNNDIFTTLASGGCLCIPSEDDRINNLAHAIRVLQANIVFLTPTIANLLSPQDVPGLQTMFLAGEPVTLDILKVWAASISLVNIYGPSECAIWCTYHPCMTHDTIPTNIGRAITGRCWIVSPQNTELLMPIGSIGELLIEGPQVARGYINDSRKTQANFISKPN